MRADLRHLVLFMREELCSWLNKPCLLRERDIEETFKSKIAIKCAAIPGVFTMANVIDISFLLFPAETNY